MLNVERVSLMTKMAMTETKKSKIYQPIIRFTKKDYLALNMVGAFLSGTLFFIAVFGGGLALFLSLVKDYHTIVLILILVLGFMLYLLYILKHMKRAQIRIVARYKEGIKVVEELRSDYDKLMTMYDEDAN